MAEPENNPYSLGSNLEEICSPGGLQILAPPVVVASTIPGYFVTIYFIDRTGRRRIQLCGFFFMSISLFSLVIPYDKYWKQHFNAGYIILYSLTFFFSNFGPNTTTFIVPAELFPARLRSTCHRMSRAAGKMGAITGAIGFLWASQSK
ncbi:probable inorganic phosphate transporter 1-10 [Zingiber officinale]|uniref:probable inorganic phosphate transporter 1-10 n=1 Tax=Zingiber officinale TaxID=94328 RepID=UPI001C4B6D96|nr:probable inorganic phosphate transporter 1-10 [Zingiber officinale]